MQISPGTLSPGTPFADRYRIDAEVGRGTFGIVYRAYDFAEARDVAIKVLNAAAASDATLKQRLRREAKLMREMSLQSDPQKMVASYGLRVRKLFGNDGFVSVSRRNIAAPKFRVTRSSAWKEQPDPWREPPAVFARLAAGQEVDPWRWWVRMLLGGIHAVDQHVIHVQDEQRMVLSGRHGWSTPLDPRSDWMSGSTEEPPPAPTFLARDAHDSLYV